MRARRPPRWSTPPSSVCLRGHRSGSTSQSPTSARSEFGDQGLAAVARLLPGGDRPVMLVGNDGVMALETQSEWKEGMAMDASTGAIGARGSAGGSVRWAAVALALLVAIGGGVLLGRALVPNPAQPVRVVERLVPEGTETLPSDIRDLAVVKSTFGRSAGAALGVRLS